MRVISRIDPDGMRKALHRRKARPAHDADGRILVVHGAKGGVGASVLAANLAAALTRYAGPIALVDLALASADQDLLWNLECRLRLDDVLGSDGHELADALVSHPKGVRLLAGPVGPAEAEAVSTSGIRSLLATLAERHPYVVVDTSPELSEAAVCALEMASRIIVPLIPELPALRGTQRLLSVLDKLGLDLGTVQLCMWTRQSELEAASAARVLGRTLDWNLPWAPKAVQESVNAGQPLILSQPRHSLSVALFRMAAQIAGAPAPEPPTWKSAWQRLRHATRGTSTGTPTQIGASPPMTSPQPGVTAERSIAHQF